VSSRSTGMTPPPTRGCAAQAVAQLYFLARRPPEGHETQASGQSVRPDGQ
jgi:hypothetical protein